MFQYNSDFFSKHVRNVLEQSEMFPNKPKIFLIVQNIMKYLTTFIGNFSYKHFSSTLWDVPKLI